MKKIIEIKELKVNFKVRKGEVTVVDGIDLYVNEGETLGIVGESGSGKSITSLSIMGLLPPNGRIANGTITFNGRKISGLGSKEMRKIRGKEIAMIFQEPMTSLNPSYTIGNQLIEPLQIHLKMSKSEAKKKAIELLELVDIPRAKEVIENYPHQLSGGMRQRVVIAIGLSCNPKLLIADEPTTALDVTIQAQILELMKRITKENQTSTILITHDLGVIAEMANRVIVMYAGKKVEEAPVEELFDDPKHPYTVGLLNSMPKLREKREKLFSIKGNVPTPDKMPYGCRFAERCDKVLSICSEKEPPLYSVSEHQNVSCWLYSKELIENVSIG